MEGANVHCADGRVLLDATAGWCSQHVMGYSHPIVLDAMREQMSKFCHVDYNAWRNPMLEELAELLLQHAPQGIDKVYFSGNSGSEATEAAMKLSYQTHYNEGKPGKKWFISREQGYHGATLQSMAVSQIDILEFYEPIKPPFCALIPPHYPHRCMKEGETLEEYARRGARDLENKILELGPENVCAFIGETMLGSLVGDVPPAPGYWKLIREVCDRYDVHLILDEVYCGLGRSSKVYCCDWDDISPDFICVGKALGAGYGPLSAVLTRSRVEDVIKAGQGRINHGHTHQGYSLAAAAALAIQKIVQTDEMLAHIALIGERIRGHLKSELSQHPFFREVRGRGSLFSFEYECPDLPKFSSEIQQTLDRDHRVLVSAKWHRMSYSPPFILTTAEMDRIAEASVSAFKSVAKRWGA